MPTPAKRHQVDVMRPPPNFGQKGNESGQDETITKDWPCSIKTLIGRELERAMQIVATAELAVEGYGNPNKPIKEKDYLQFGERRLNVMGIIDEQQNGIHVKLLCGEERQQ